MSRPFLIAYDVANPRRLVRLHRSLRRLATPVQYSVFLADLTEAGLAAVVAVIERTIDPTADDVRIYPLPRDGWARTAGRPLLPPGLTWTGLPLPFRPMPVELVSEDGDPSVSAGTAFTPRRLTRAQRLLAKAMQARVQTGDRRGITLL